MSTLTISLIQSSLHWEDKAANLNMFTDKISSIPMGTEIIVMPEMFSTGFSMQPEILAESMEGETIQWMKRMAAEKKMILTGSVIVEEKATYYNRLIWMMPNGQWGLYDKRHLFAYAGEDEHYVPGNKRLVASVKGWKILLQICYDLRFPVWSRQQIIQDGPEFDVLIYVANWPEKRNHAWKTLLMARAIENQCYVIGVNRVGHDGNDIYHSGDSMVVDPMGEVLYQKTHDEDIFTISLQQEKLKEVRSKLPFWKDGDNFTIEL